MSGEMDSDKNVQEIRAGIQAFEKVFHAKARVRKKCRRSSERAIMTEHTCYVVDLFCGIGGFSTGAEQGGGHVALAADANCEALRVHHVRHPRARARAWTLGGDVDATAARVRAHLNAQGIDPDRAVWHVHASPPCKMLSSSATFRRRDGLHRADENIALTRWSLDLIEKLRPTTWSLEQVPARQLRDYLDARGVPYAVVNAADYGVPQARRRAIAGPRALVDALTRAASVAPTVTPRAALRGVAKLPDDARLQLGTDNTPVRGGGFRKIAPGEHARNLDTSAYTVTGKSLKIVSRGAFAGTLNARALAALQGFPPGYVPSTVADSRARKLVADCVPPPLARAIMLAARGVRANGA